jgi:peptide/nickel transport system permease protein
MRTVRRFLAFRSNWLALALVAALAGVAILAPRLAPQRQEVPLFPPGLPGEPNREHLLGTTPNGRDIYRLLIWGTRDAFRFGLTVTILTALAGVAVGAIAGYVGGLTNTLLMRATDAFLAFPAVASVWLFQQVLLQGDLSAPTPWQALLFRLRADPIMLALIAFSWMPYARLINTNIIRLKQQAFVEAARAQGLGHLRILLRHLLPNAIGPAVVVAARDIGGMVVLATAFNFIGVGFGGTGWGRLLVENRGYIIGSGGNPLRYWWTFVPVTTALMMFGIGWNLLGDGMNRMLDPRQRPARRGRVRP